MRYRTLNPATGELIETYPLASSKEVDEALRASVQAFSEWRRVPLSKRASLLMRVADLLEGEAGRSASLMALEMGKPIAQGVAELEKCALVCRYYAEQAPTMFAEQELPSDGKRSYVRSDALGPLLAIMPWNFPFWQVFRCVAPALMAGNTVLLKHAPCTPRCALAIARLMSEAGFVPGVFQSFFLDNEQAASVIGDERVRGVSLTGSTRAGRAVASIAASHLKPMVLELGGSDPFVVFGDTDLQAAVEAGVMARCLNSGQSCIAAKRFLVDESVFDRFTEEFVMNMERQVVGDPADSSVAIGPLAREDLRDGLARQVSSCLKSGARALCGGKALRRRGFFYPPTVLVGASENSPAAREELFGPVASLFSFSSEEQAVAMANGTGYGLGASVWTGDSERAERMIESLEAGSVFINGLVKSDPRLPFGGVKDSGFGRELASEGALEFVNRKTVWIGNP